MKGAATPTIDGLPDREALQQIGLLIDSASDARSTQDTELAFTLLDQFAAKKARAKNYSPHALLPCECVGQPRAVTLQNE